MRCLDMTKLFDDVLLKGRSHARVKGTLRKKLSKEDLTNIQKKVYDYIQSHPENVGTVTIMIGKNGEIVGSGKKN